MVDRVVVEVSVAEWGGGGDEGGCEEESGVVETSVDMCSGSGLSVGGVCGGGLSSVLIVAARWAVN